MTRRRYRSAGWIHLGLALSILTVPFLAHGQEQGPGYISVRFAAVKPGEVAQFEAAIKDIGEALRAGGSPFFHVYQRIRGEQGYTIISLDGAYNNNLPQIELAPALIQRVTATLNSTSLLTLAIYPEIGIASGSLEPAGNFMYVRVRTTSPANREAYFEWQRDELVPALQQAGLNDRRAGRLVAGGNVNTFVEFTYSNEFQGNLDIAGTVGQRRFEQIIARGDALTASAEDFRYRFRRDLSFTAPPQQ